MILAYHEIVEKESPYIYTVTATRLAEHFDSIKAAGERSKDLVTFDDGHASQFRHAIPLLAAAGIKATFFITAGWTDVKPQYMTTAQLRQVVREGHSVQAHGWSHKLLTHCTPAELESELRLPKDRLENLLGMPVDAISLPGGRWNKRVLSSCVEVGYRQVYTSEIAESSIHFPNLLLLGRNMVKNSTTQEGIRRSLASPPTGNRRQLSSYFLKRLGRGIVGDQIYGYMWRLIGSKRTCQKIDAEYVQ